MCWFYQFVLGLVLIVQLQSQEVKIIKIPLKRAQKQFEGDFSDACEKNDFNKGYYSDLTYSGEIYHGFVPNKKLRTIFDTRYNEHWIVRNFPDNLWNESCFEILDQYSGSELMPEDFQLILDFSRIQYRGQSLTTQKYLILSSLVKNVGLLHSQQVYFIGNDFYHLQYLRASSVFGLGIQNTFISRMYMNKKLEEPVFSFYFDSNNESSFLMLGGYDENVLLNPYQIVWVTLFDPSSESDADWKIQAKRVGLGSAYLSIKAAVLDTSSSFIRVSKDKLIKFSQFISTEVFVELSWTSSPLQRMMVPCKFRSSIPSFSLMVEDIIFQTRELIIPNSSFLIKSTLNEYYTDAEESQREEMCEFLITSTEGDHVDDDTVILGTSFLENYVSIFNTAQKHVGLSKSKELH